MNKELFVDPKEILKIVCDYYGMPEEKVMGKSRSKEIMKARHVARFLIRFNTDVTLKYIAQLMIGSKHKGNDHTTIVNSCKVVTDWMETDEDFNHEVQSIQLVVMEYKRAIMDKLKAELLERKLMQLSKEPPQLPTTRLIRVVDMSEHEKLIAKYV